MIDRRQVIFGLGAAASVAAFPSILGTPALGEGERGADAHAGSAPQDGQPPHRIDVHYHIMAPDWVREPAVHKLLPPGSVKAVEAWTAEGALADMDRNGIATIIGSPLVPGVWLGEVAQGRRLARTFNAYVAQIGRQYPNRFGLFAALPLPDVDGSLAELAFALDTLGADGVSLYTSYDDHWLGDAVFDPVFAELNRRKAVVFVHPASPICCRALMPGLNPSILEYATDTTRAIANIALKGTARRFPDIRFIFSHAGGTMFAAVGRFDALVNGRDPEHAPIPGGLAHELGRFYYEISNSTSRINMFALHELVPKSHVLLGTDSPLGPTAPTVRSLAELGLPADELAGIERNNALALFPRFARRA